MRPVVSPTKSIQPTICGINKKAAPPSNAHQSLVSPPMRIHGIAATTNIAAMSAKRWLAFQSHQITMALSYVELMSAT